MSNERVSNLIPIIGAVFTCIACSTEQEHGFRSSTDSDVAEERISEAISFRGPVVEVLEDGTAIRETMLYHGVAFTWKRRLGKRVAQRDDALPAGKPTDIASLTVEELAQDLRRLLLFKGHEFLEAEPPYEHARRVKEVLEARERGATPEELQDLLPDAEGPFQGSLPSTDPRIAEGFGDQKFVHGDDDRIVLDNEAYPHRTHIVLDNDFDFLLAINRSEGTASLIGPSTAMSVAHVFWDENNGTWEADHMWAPGYDSADSPTNPHGSWYQCLFTT